MKSAAYNKTLCSKQHWMMNEKPNLHLPSLEPQCEKRQTNKQHTEQKKRIRWLWVNDIVLFTICLIIWPKQCNLQR